MKKGLQKKINTVKEKPLEDRKRIAKIAALVVTGITVLVWLGLTTLLKDPNKEPRRLFDTTKLEDMFGTAAEQFDDIKDTFKKQKNVITDVKENFKTQKALEKGLPLGSEESLEGIQNSESFDENTDEITQDIIIEIDEENLDNSTKN